MEFIQFLFGVFAAGLLVGTLQIVAVCVWRRDPAFTRMLDSSRFRAARGLVIVALGLALTLSQHHPSLSVRRNFDVLIDAVRRVAPDFTR
jgi:hypothetical protein